MLGKFYRAPTWAVQFGEGPYGVCMGDALRGQKKDVSKFTITINSDGTLTFHSDGWPNLKLTKKTEVVVSSLSGHYEGSVPFILDMNLIFPGDGTVNFDQDVTVAHKEIKCPTEKIAETATAVTFPNIATTGDCMGDALRGPIGPYKEGPISPKPKSHLCPAVWGALQGKHLQSFFGNLENPSNKLKQNTNLSGFIVQRTFTSTMM